LNEDPLSNPTSTRPTTNITIVIADRHSPTTAVRGIVDRGRCSSFALANGVLTTNAAPLRVCSRR
jgi:hypothetical protein